MAQIRTIRYNKERRCTCTLYMTEACNLNCVYCYERLKGNATLSQEIAQRAIESTFQRAVGERVELVEILFHGGEPFLAFDRIKTICEWLWSRTWPLKYICYATTNGTLVHGSIQEWLSLNKHRFVVGLSLDGTPQMHNRNRSESFDKIDIDYFRREWPEQGVKMTPSPGTIGTLADGVIYIHRLGFQRNNCTFASGVDWQHDEFGNEVEYSQILQREFHKLACFYLDNPDIVPVDMMSPKFAAVAAGLQSLTDKLCGAGTTMRCWTPDGQCLPCHLFYEVCKERKTELPPLDLNDPERLSDKACAGCILEPVCPTCYGGNYITYGDVSKRDPATCFITKLRALAGSWMVGKMLECPEKYALLKEFTPEELAMTAKGVLQTQRFLKESGFIGALNNG